MLNIDETTKILIPHSIDNWLCINDRRYFVKRQRTKVDYSEIIVEKICARLGIINAHYEGIRMGHKLYLLSEDLAYYGAFEPTSEHSPKNLSLYTYWYLFEKHYPGYSKELLDELIKVFLLDIIIKNPDRNNTNWGILTTMTGPHICILDNELLLSGNEVKVTSFYSNDSYLKCLEYKKENTKELEYFLDTSSEEYIFLFEQMLSIITPEVFAQILDEIETEYQDSIYEKRWAISEFSKNYFELNQILEPYLHKYQR